MSQGRGVVNAGRKFPLAIIFVEGFNYLTVEMKFLLSEALACYGLFAAKNWTTLK
jgi:hypothetical protein